MIRLFIMTKLFDASWENLHLSDDDLKLLQGDLLRSPTCGAIMRGTGGFRKMRFALPGRGKSGGLRVIYLDIPELKTLYLMLAYPKSEKDTLSPAECTELKQISTSIKKNLRAQGRKGY
jgi:hypothetical protein